ncbi:hypothetical protein [Mobiluncus mulieris]|uniref:GHMP kinase N-terminal domain-containing protein n=1 Tax=Mobiluncus mulieris TaxID=2052 RepID=A0A7Y0YHU5_9ACTO|nr:hypothetical protein [Mobiluncus mulieris]NMX03372.1 hypothetical protein [Mobiluncus mulieris]NMX12019.1 hypothetical protein [Mobiluncus mulieris]
MQTILLGSMSGSVKPVGGHSCEMLMPHFHPAVGTIAKGKQNGTIGELWQGPYQSLDGIFHIAIVTLPCKRYVSEVTVEYGKTTPALPPKSAKAIERFISYFNIESTLSSYSWTLQSNIPQSIGMASSTADIIATINALAALHEVRLSANHIQDILRGIERSDPVFHQYPGLYLSKCQRFVSSWDCRPDFNVVYSILPGATTTESVDESKLLGFYQDNLRTYQDSLTLLDKGFRTGIPALIGTAATECAGIFQNFRPVQLVDELIKIAPKVGALGVVRAYTGHVAGLLFPEEVDSYTGHLPIIRNIFDRYGLVTLIDRAGYGNS